MPALPSVAKVVRVDFQQSIGPNTRVRNRLFFRYAGAGPTNADLLTFLNTVSAAWNTNLSPLLVTQSTLSGLAGTDLTSPTAARAVNTTAHPGTVAGTGTFAGYCLIVAMAIQRRYRGGHPRFYAGGVAETNQLNANQWNSTTLTAWNSGFSAFITACVAAPPATMGVTVNCNVSYFLGFHNVTLPSGRQRSVPTLRGTPITDDILFYTARIQVGSQRRRNQQSA